MYHDTPHHTAYVHNFLNYFMFLFEVALHTDLSIVKSLESCSITGQITVLPMGSTKSTVTEVGRLAILNIDLCGEPADGCYGSISRLHIW